MSDKESHIGIFHTRFPLQSHTMYVAKSLAEAGYCVDLFIYDVLDLCDIERYRDTPNLVIFDTSVRNYQFYLPDPITRISQSNAHSIITSLNKFKRYARATMSDWYQRFLESVGSYFGLVPQKILNQTYQAMSGKNYRCLIGVEKNGLSWAGIVGTKLGIPFIYYSLELYTRDYPGLSDMPYHRRLKRSEEKYHRSSLATIIQDFRRAEILFRDNQVDNTHVIYLPVSLPGKPHYKKSSFLRNRLQIPDNKFIIIVFGIIDETRWSVDLVKLNYLFQDNWHLVLHGYGTEEEIDKIRRLADPQKCSLSLDRLDTEDIPNMIASANVGLVLYKREPINDYLTAFSSEKLALYLQCGLPVVAFNYPGYELLEEEGCGALIDDVYEIPRAISTIEKDYSTFSKNAYKCFLRYYEFSKNFESVLNYIDSLG